MLKIGTLGIFGSAGMAVAANLTPQIAPNETAPDEEVAYFYYNVATGETVATLVQDGVRPADLDNSVDIWVADNRLPCAAFGQTGGFSYVMDDIDDTDPIGATHLTWGDIPNDTVVDCVQVRWSTRHVDVDTDNDGVGDGVEVFGCTWTWYDGDNGFNTCFTRTGLIGFSFFNLAGRTTGGTALSVYTLVVDLASAFTSSLTFEIGDSDSDPQGAAVHNAGFANGDLDSDGVPDGDLDSDGLADFAYAQRYYQPGTRDWDNADGDDDPLTGVDGDPNAAGDCGNSLVAPDGDVVGDAYDTFDNIAPLPAGQGMEDDWDIFTDLNSDGFFEYVGTFWFGGFTCDEDGDGVPGGNGANIRSYGQFWHRMLGPGSGCNNPADFFPVGGGDDILDFFDVSQFLTYYNAMDPLADLFPIGAPDGNFDFFDVSQFLTFYNAGCP